MARCQCLYEKNTGTRAWEETLIFGIGQDGLWHFACDDSPFAYIMLVATFAFFTWNFFSSLTIKAALGCPNLHRGID